PVGSYTLRAKDVETQAEGSADVKVFSTTPVVDAGPNGSITAGAHLSRSGSFTAPGEQQFTATVDYGDGTGEHPLQLGPYRDFVLDHVYTRAGTWTVTVTVVGGTDSGSGSFQVTVAPGPVARFQVEAPASVPEGQRFAVRLTALDAFGNVATNF